MQQNRLIFWIVIIGILLFVLTMVGGYIITTESAGENTLKISTLPATSTISGDQPVNIATSTAPKLGQSVARVENLGTTTGTVIGYIWKSEQGGPKFLSVNLPAWGLMEKDFGTRQYDIYILKEGKFVFYQKAKPMVDDVKFPEGGVTQFKVLGIDPRLNICSSDRNVTWGIKFAETGVFKGIREAITNDIPNTVCAGRIAAELK